MPNEVTTISASVSDRGLSEKRPENEDSYLEIGKIGLFAVADGVGGAQAGEVASQMAMEVLAEAFSNCAPDADKEAVMRSAIEQANSAIFQMAQDLPQLSRMATTIVALHLDGNVATIGHVGDSRLYRLDPTGDLHRETDDHSMVAEEVRAGRMTEEQADNHPSRNIISRALGAEATVHPDLKTIMVEPRTNFLLCSDGVTRHLTDQEIKGVLTFGGSPADICDYIKNLCYQRGAEDNLTAVAVKLTAANPKPGALAPDESGDDDEVTITSPRFTADTALTNGEAPESSAAIVPTLEKPSDATQPEYDEDVNVGATPTVGDQGWSSPAAAQSEKELDPTAISADDRTTGVVVEDEAVPLPERAADSASPIIREPSSGEVEEPAGSFIGKVFWTLTLLVMGAVIGIAAFYLMVVKPQQAQRQPNYIPAITEMESRNQQLTAFEENRRTVDQRPAEALAQFGASPVDAEDFFLVGRARMLLGQYPEARMAFSDSRSRMAAGDVDPINRKTLETEIAIAMAALNDTTVQGILRSQLAGSGASSGPNAK